MARIGLMVSPFFFFTPGIRVLLPVAPAGGDDLGEFVGSGFTSPLRNGVLSFFRSPASFFLSAVWRPTFLVGGLLSKDVLILETDADTSLSYF
jgi:hypothetical protein